MLGGLALGFVPGLPQRRAGSGARARRDPAAAPLRGRVLHVAARVRREPAADRPARGRARARDDGRRSPRVAHELVGLAWAPAFVLGAVVSPTDPIAATAIARRLGVPRRLVVVIEGESLVNDGTALVVYRFAVVAVVDRDVLVLERERQLRRQRARRDRDRPRRRLGDPPVRRRLDNPPAEITIALLSGYFAYLPAEALGVSAVLAAVTAGLYVGWHTPELTNSQTSGSRATPSGRSSSSCSTRCSSACSACSCARSSTASRRTRRRRLVCYARCRQRRGDRRRGSSGCSRRRTCRAALPADSRARAVPAVAGAGRARAGPGCAARSRSPRRSRCRSRSTAAARSRTATLIIFLTFCVILVTLVVQGLTLPAVIRLLGLEDDGSTTRRRRRRGSRRRTRRSPGSTSWSREDWVREDTAERVRGSYRFRREPLRGALRRRRTTARSRSARRSYQRLRRELLEAERAGGRRAAPPAARSTTR